MIRAAERVLAGSFEVFELTFPELGFPPPWCADPKSGRAVPMVFGKTLDYRRLAGGADIRYLWELNRHRELVTLAQAWWLSRDARYAAGCRELLDSWWAANPHGMGPNWVSALEAALRLVNWSFAWHLLQDSPALAGEQGDALRGRWLRSVYEHTAFIAGYLSRHSSANNHLLGELAGMFVASLTWPCWPVSRQWRARSLAELEQQARLQVAPDGVNREQAVGYHREVAELMIVCTLVGRANGVEFTPDWVGRLFGMIDFVHAITDVAGQVPMFGDSDDARVLVLDPSPGFDPFGSLCETGAVLFDKPEWLRNRAAGPGLQTRWLLGNPGAAGVRLAAPRPGAATGVRAFPAGGHWVMGHRLGAKDEIRVVADAGPLGYLGIAAHGHADALSFTLSVGGQPVLVDVGTFCYSAHPSWRRWFCSTRAHNTLCLDGKSQAEHAGPFLWLRHYAARCLHWSDQGERQRWIGEHDGYRRLRGAPRHRRELVVDGPRAEIVVLDTLESKASHEVELCWHFHPSCRVTLDGSVARVVAAGVELDLHLPEGEFELVDHVGRVARADDEPGPGWFSPEFGRRFGSTALIVKLEAVGGGRWQTVFRIRQLPG